MKQLLLFISFSTSFLVSFCQSDAQKKLEAEMSKFMNYRTVRSAIEEGANPNTSNSEGMSVLHYMIVSGMQMRYDDSWIKENMQFLIQKGANINAGDKDGWTPLHFAVSEGMPEAARILIDAGASVDAIDKRGRTPLAASKSWSGEAVTVLCDKGADKNPRDYDGVPLLILLMSKNEYGIVQLLIEKGADLNVSNRNGTTALHYAVVNNKLGVIRFLLENGANVNALNQENETPLWIAHKNQLTELVFLLEKYNGMVRDANGDLRPLGQVLEREKDKSLPGPYYATFHLRTDPGEAEVYLEDNLGNKQDWGTTPRTSEKNKWLSRIFSSIDGTAQSYTIVVEKRGYKAKKYTFIVRYKYFGVHTDHSIVQKDFENIMVILETGGGDGE